MTRELYRDRGRELNWRVMRSSWDEAAGRTLHIALENGRLIGDMDGRGKQDLVVMSEGEFTGLYGLGVQFVDGGLFVKHVSGNYRFARK